MSKNSIRKNILQRREALSASDVRSLSLQVATRFLDSELFQSAATVALYSAIRSEVSTDEIIARAVQAGKRVLFPRTVGVSLEFVAVTDLADLVTGRMGVAEPQSGQAVPLHEIDVMVVPGVAFDLQGIRLGYGVGCYDRFLEKREHTLLVGLAYELQIVDTLPREGHDIPVDIIVTEGRFLTIPHASHIQCGAITAC